MKTNNSNRLQGVYLAGSMENKIITVNKAGQRFKRKGKKVGFLTKTKYSEEKKIRAEIYQAPIVKNAYSLMKGRIHISTSKIIKIKDFT